jgi:uncharacterized protein (TIGR02453 family)
MDFQAALRFLDKLSKNNDRDWFERNKHQYLRVKEDFDTFVAEVLTEFSKFDGTLGSLNPKKLAFRIYRDVRFSKDKRPYKNNLSAGFSPNGKMAQEPGYYLQIERGGKSFIAGGLYLPEAAQLANVRQEIDYNTEKFLKIINDKKFKKLFGTLEDTDKLKFAPKGYDRDHPYIDLLKNKSFIVSHIFSDKEVKDRNFLKQVVASAKAIKPLNDFLRNAIG